MDSTATDGQQAGPPLGLGLSELLGPLPGNAHNDEPAYSSNQVARLIAEHVASERERWAPMVAALLDTELGELASAGSHAPVEDVLGRMKAALGPNDRVNRAGTAPLEQRG